MSTETDRKLRVINGAALSEAIADLAAQVSPSTTSALIATLWKSLPEGVADGIVHQAAMKLGPVDQREVFAGYKNDWEA